MGEILTSVAGCAVLLALGVNRAPLWAWALATAGFVFAWQSGLPDGRLSAQWPTVFGLMGYIVPVILGVIAIPSVRRATLVAPAFGIVCKVLPKVSSTEQQALDAGTVGFDAELFSGQPDWAKLRKVAPIELTDEERAFLDGPTQQLCAMIDDWQIRHNDREVPDHIWDFIKANGFLGMLISKEHGGLGFSAQAQSLILGKVSSRSPDVSIIVMVPNSLGPGELIEKYGTEHQKAHYLPRLAKGQEVPCFALTGPTSGSDAATMRDVGYVAKGMHDGRETLGVRLSWDKRYITLAPKATLLGLAFRLFDPDNLMGETEDVGITVAMIPTDHPGVNIGRRHLPCGAMFPNGPNWGEDVFIPMDWIIGGEEMVGQGWRMLMECLAAGRAISLPASATACAKTMLRHTTSYARIRKQFGLSVGRMEGVEEAIVRIAENAYVNEAARSVTASMVSAGEKPSVISALMKYQTTERMRQCVADAMDVHGGKAICDGPSNYIQAAYQAVPIGITVEGANILTRTLITFAQGALRSHPYLYREIQAAQNPDREAGLAAFEDAFTGHIGYAVSNVCGAFWHNISGGRFAPAPGANAEAERWYQQLTRQSRNFALVADLTVATLGGGLKTKQRITGRLADALSELYLVSCVLKRYEDDGYPKEDRVVVELAARNGLFRVQEALMAAISNFPITPARWLMRACVFPLGRHYAPASDKLGRAVGKLVLAPTATRDRLTRDMFVSNDVNDVTGLLEVTFTKVIAAEDAEKRLEKAVRKGVVRRYHGEDWFAEAVNKGVITSQEADQLRELEQLVAKVIAVDHFDPDALRPNYLQPGHNARGVETAEPPRQAAE
ncbi:MAG: acyl-CoA dehydrogenase [Pseudomonadota bacterium]